MPGRGAPPVSTTTTLIPTGTGGLMRPKGPPQQGTKSIPAERERIVEQARQAQRQAQQTVAEELLLSLPTKYDLERTGGRQPEDYEKEREYIRQSNYQQLVTPNSSSYIPRPYSFAFKKPLPSQVLLDKGLGSLEEVKDLDSPLYQKLNLLQTEDLDPEQVVSIRPNLSIANADKTKGVIVHTIHDRTYNGPKLGTVYGAVIKDPEFLVNPREQLRIQAGVKPKGVMSSIQGELVRTLSMDDSIMGKINRDGVVARFNPKTTDLYVVPGEGDKQYAIKSVKGEVVVEGTNMYIPSESTIQYYTPQELEEIDAKRKKIAKEEGLNADELEIDYTPFAYGGFVDKPLYPR